MADHDGQASEGLDHDASIAQFMGITGATPDEANYYLTQQNWNVAEAVAMHQAVREGSGSEEDEDEEEDDSETPTHPSGGRTLGSAGPTDSALPPATSQSTSTSKGKSKSSRPKKKFATLGDLGAASPSDNDDSEPEQDFFAGGEKSGLAVQNPDDLKKKIIEKAKKSAKRPGGDDVRPEATNFRGPAQTLGGDDAPSQVIQDPRANVPQPAERVERRLHFWSNGFSVDDGRLYDTNDPDNPESERNQTILRMIQSGRAPLDIMDVRRDQEVDVKVETHEGPYVAPKKVWKPFSGGGQRLGSPTPGISGSASTPAPAPAPAAAAAASAASGSLSSATKVIVDDSQPSLSLQIRLGDGSRLVSRFNNTHTVGDVYSFVASASSVSDGRNWVLMTTFPNKDLTDKSAILGETPETKRGGVVVQKWT